MVGNAETVTSQFARVQLMCYGPQAVQHVPRNSSHRSRLDAGVGKPSRARVSVLLFRKVMSRGAFGAFFHPRAFFFAPPPRLARARSPDVSPVIYPFNLRQSSRFDLRSTLLPSSFPLVLKFRQEVLARPLSATPSFSATVQPLSATDRR